MESLDKVLFLILGWLFGLLSPAIVDSIRKRREAKEVKIAFCTELHELQYRLANTIGLIEMRYGQPNRAFFEWLYSKVKEYSGINSSEEMLRVLESQLIFTDEQFTNTATLFQYTTEGGLVLRKQYLPLLDAKIGSLSWLNEKLRNQLLEIKTRVGIINETVDEARTYFNLTFQNNITTENYNIAKENMIKSYKRYAEQARIVVDLIGKMK